MGTRAPRASGVVPLLPVTGAGRPPSMEAVRAAERLAASASTVVLPPAAPELPNPFAAFFDKPKTPEPEPEPEPEAPTPFEAFGKMFGGDK